MSAWATKVRERHQKELVDGLHDQDCEFRSEGFWLCHCSKRRREARGFTTPPNDDLYFPPPYCNGPDCYNVLEHDGDSWRCYTCNLSWDSAGSGSSARFTDDYGPDLATEVSRWDQRALNHEGSA
jgi:hypothetical protein